jgi:hypothetical protein
MTSTLIFADALAASGISYLLLYEMLTGRELENLPGHSGVGSAHNRDTGTPSGKIDWPMMVGLRRSMNT